MIITKELESCLRTACKEYKEMVSKAGSDNFLIGGLSADEYYNMIEDNIEDFCNQVLEHPFFVGKDYVKVSEIAEKEHSLFMYCFQNFLNDKFVNSLITTSHTDNAIKVNPDIMEPINEEPTDFENKKNFVKEVLDGVPKKNYLKDFLTDPRSYKQWRDDVDRCLLYMNWEKIHRVMKDIKWKWNNWVDEDFNGHTNTTPSVFGIREHVYDMIQRIEDWIMEHPEEKEYRCGTGGFEYEMYVCDSNEDTDDYNSRVKFIVRFVLEQYDNGM